MGILEFKENIMDVLYTQIAILDCTLTSMDGGDKFVETSLFSVEQSLLALHEEMEKKWGDEFDVEKISAEVEQAKAVSA